MTQPDPGSSIDRRLGRALAAARRRRRLRAVLVLLGLIALAAVCVALLANA